MRRAIQASTQTARDEETGESGESGDSERRLRYELIRQRLRQAEADAARQASEQALTDFREAAERREREMYRDLCSRVVRVREIENVLQGVCLLYTSPSPRD